MPLCNNRANYKNVTGSRLPFQFELVTASSNLYPDKGENQKFYYTITANGEDSSVYRDLCHFVLEISSTLTRNNILNFQANGKPDSTWTLGKDPTTECTGLKYDFDPSLSKVNGRFSFSFELANPLPIGPVTICVKGGTQTLNTLTICGPICNGGGGECDTTVHHEMNISTPVTVTPSVTHGTIVTRCCGRPEVVNDECPSTNGQQSCTFHVVQPVCVEIPLHFSANTEVGSANVQCTGNDTEQPVQDEISKLVQDLVD